MYITIKVEEKYCWMPYLYHLKFVFKIHFFKWYVMPTYALLGDTVNCHHHFSILGSLEGHKSRLKDFSLRSIDMDFMYHVIKLSRAHNSLKWQNKTINLLDCRLEWKHLPPYEVPSFLLQISVLSFHYCHSLILAPFVASTTDYL